MTAEEVPPTQSRDRLAEITLDEASIARGNANIEHEREGDDEEIEFQIQWMNS